ncbi:hypothetical protein J41TS12_36790 [Paenibacillus antibioticophila]|uniref:Uncharacterized protein n=1 Tax=Paenibacillus antibioticophila TaxID=1274374 RepID=A0A920CIK3_9BACL|nr:hypothetical protein J41TS12_36790 [Paenibacillus antibioticophila]
MLKKEVTCCLVDWIRLNLVGWLGGMYVQLDEDKKNLNPKFGLSYDGVIIEVGL